MNLNKDSSVYHVNALEKGIRTTVALLVFACMANLLSAQTTTEDHSEILDQFSELSDQLRFEENLGQHDDQVLFKANDAQATHFFLKNEIRTVIREKGDEPKNYAYSIEFLNTEEATIVEPRRKMNNHRRGKQNYITKKGSFPDVQQYGNIIYRDLWKNIDASFYESEGQVKYDFIVLPGADPKQVSFKLNGGKDIKVNEAGELEFTTAFGVLQKGQPYTYQEIKGKKIPIDAKYQINGDIISFEIGSYNKDFPLIIDPIALKWSTYLGGAITDVATDIFVDEVNDLIYIIGETNMQGFPATTGIPTIPSSGYPSFVTCLSRDGTTLIWSTMIEDVHLYGITVGDSGDIFIGGVSGVSGLPSGTVAGYNPVLSGSTDFAIIRLDPTGSILRYSTYLGGGRF